MPELVCYSLTRKSHEKRNRVPLFSEHSSDGVVGTDTTATYESTHQGRVGLEETRS